MNPVLPPREHISRVGVEHAATPGMALPGGGFPLFEPVAYCSLRHVHALCHFCLRQALRAKGRHLAIAIITTGLACLMGFFNLRRSPLLPGDGGRQGANDLLRQGQRALLLANFCTAVSQDESPLPLPEKIVRPDRKSTRLNSSHGSIAYAVSCLKKKRIQTQRYQA